MKVGLETGVVRLRSGIAMGALSVKPETCLQAAVGRAGLRSGGASDNPLRPEAGLSKGEYVTS